MAINAEAYLAAAHQAVTRAGTTQREQVARAARLIADAVVAGGVVQTFGSGHSEALAMELAGRAGGLVPTNRLALRDVVLYGGEPAAVLDNGVLERDPGVGRRVFELAEVGPHDVFVVASNSGINGSVVELARLVRARGLPLVAVTSLRHSAEVASRHPSGQRLTDLADVVLDNGAPLGDAVLPLPGGGAACAVSSLTGALLAQMVVADVIGDLLGRGITPPVYLSANTPGGDAHNDTLEARYAGRIRRTA